MTYSVEVAQGRRSRTSLWPRFVGRERSVPGCDAPRRAPGLMESRRSASPSSGVEPRFRQGSAPVDTAGPRRYAVLTAATYDREGLHADPRAHDHLDHYHGAPQGRPGPGASALTGSAGTERRGLPREAFLFPVSRGLVATGKRAEVAALCDRGHPSGVPDLQDSDGRPTRSGTLPVALGRLRRAALRRRRPLLHVRAALRRRASRPRSGYDHDDYG